MDAEMVRDAALAVSGLLVTKVGGKSVKPYQPPGLWEAIGYSGSNTVHFVQDHGDALYRRSLYTFWKRTSPPPSLDDFRRPVPRRMRRPPRPDQHAAAGAGPDERRAVRRGGPPPGRTDDARRGADAGRPHRARFPIGHVPPADGRRAPHLSRRFTTRSRPPTAKMPQAAAKLLGVGEIAARPGSRPGASWPPGPWSPT